MTAPKTGALLRRVALLLPLALLAGWPTLAPATAQDEPASATAASATADTAAGSGAEDTRGGLVQLVPPGPERVPDQRPADLPAPTPVPDPFGYESSERFEPEVVPTREAILARAAAFAEHEWTPTAANLQHGPDPDGVHVDTPDASYWDEGGFEVGVSYRGLPYQWGGFSSRRTFDEGLAAGRYAGHVFKAWDPEARPDMSFYAVGLDCSGFVSRCWSLPRKQSTRSLPDLCRELDGYDELLPGDVINKANQHCMLFAGWADEVRSQVLIYEATFPRVRKQAYSAEKLADAGYLPLRWKALEAAETAQAAGTERAPGTERAEEREPATSR